MELVRINTRITKAAYERMKDECERRLDSEAMTPTIGNIIVQMAIQHLPESTWEEEEQLRQDGKRAKPPRSAARPPAKAQAAGAEKE